MPRMVALICLIVALASPLLILAEASADLSRSLTDLRDRQTAEPCDGGIGDDPLVAAAAKSRPLPEGGVSMTSIIVEMLSSSRPVVAPFGRCPVGYSRGIPRGQPTTAPSRQARLQVFLI